MKIFLYVGHPNFGKSETLKYFTEGNSKKKYGKIDEISFLVRKMSNNDNVLSYIGFVTNLERNEKPEYIISAFSPDEEKDCFRFLYRMNEIAKVYIFVQKYGYKNGEVTEEEINKLRDYAEGFEVLSERLIAEDRYQRFLKFIKSNL